MRIILAPMQGVIDPIIRQLLTEINAYDLCITEFVRIVDQLLPRKVYRRICPELNNKGYTKNGTPVRIQLLGQNPHWLAENAYRASELGSHGIDFNCGCPSKTVNHNNGGAILLKKPELIYQITSSIRKAVDKQKTVSVKIRLGWDSTEYLDEIIDAIYQAKADEITIHARTKSDEYIADRINWSMISAITEKFNIPIIANGEILSVSAAKQCQLLTNTQDIMLARGAMSIPNLANMIKFNQDKVQWQTISRMLLLYINMIEAEHGQYFVSRVKQWLNFLKTEYLEAQELFEYAKTLNNNFDDFFLLIKKLEIAV